MIGKNGENKSGRKWKWKKTMEEKRIRRVKTKGKIVNQ